MSKVTHLVITFILTLSELLLPVIEHLTTSMYYAKFFMYVTHLFILVTHSTDIKNLPHTRHYGKCERFRDWQTDKSTVLQCSRSSGRKGIISMNTQITIVLGGRKEKVLMAVRCRSGIRT